MALQYSTKDGDTVDLIVYQHYGTTGARIVEQVLDANKGLADYGPILPAGVLVLLPNLDTTASEQAVKLWD